MAETQPQPNLEIFSLTFDGYIDASKPRGKRTSTLKGTRNKERGGFDPTPSVSKQVDDERV